MILQLLEQRELFVRLGAVQLLIAVNRHRSRELQDIFLLNPMGMMQLMDMLGDSEEIIRNEVMILLMDVASSNAEIQKIASFNGAFERLFDIMQDEGNTGFIVKDCLQLMVNLLRDNMFTQRYFRETSSIERLLPVFPTPADGRGANKTSAAIASLVVDVVEELGCGIPSDPQNVEHANANKELLGQTLLLAVAQVALGSKVLSEGRCAALRAICILVDTHEANASRLWRVMLPEGDHGSPRPATSQLLVSLLQHGSGDATEKKALRKVFDTFLLNSAQIQLDMAKTFGPEVQERTGLDEVGNVGEGRGRARG